MLKFFLWLIFFYFLFRILTRFIFPILLNRYIRKQEKKYRYRNEAPQPNNQENGKMKISIPRQGKDHQRAADHLGEYTDFEEEKEKE